jgi:hypothetical protein
VPRIVASVIDVIVHELSRTDACRIAVRAQLLDSPRPVDLAETVRHLTLLQYDLTAAVAPNAELVAWSRLGSACPRNAVSDAVEEQSLIDLNGLLRPVEDLVLYRAEMAEWPGVDATCSSSCNATARCPDPSYPTPAQCPGAPRVGTTTATSR